MGELSNSDDRAGSVAQAADLAAPLTLTPEQIATVAAGTLRTATLGGSTRGRSVP